MFGVHDVFAVLAARHHDDPGGSARLAEVTERAQTAIDAPPDVAATMVLQHDVERRAVAGVDLLKAPHLRLDRLELCVGAQPLQLTYDPPVYILAIAVVGVKGCRDPIADGGEDGARIGALRRALREHTRDRRDEEFDVRLRAHDAIAVPALPGD